MAGGKGNMRMTDTAHGVSFWGGTNVPKLESNDCCTIVNTLKTHHTVPFQKVNFMVREFPLNKHKKHQNSTPTF